MASTNLPHHAAEYLGKFLTGDHIEPDYESIRFSYEGHPDDENSDLRILGLTSDPNATAYYRIQYPLRHMAESGAQVQVEYVPELQYMDMRWLEDKNFVIMSRAYDKALFDAILEVCNRNKITLIYDLDDNIDSIPENNPSSNFYDQKKKEAVHHAIKNSHGVIFATRELRDTYQNLAPYSHVSPNALDISLNTRNWDEYPEGMWQMIAAGQGCDVDEDSVLFGWSGGISHVDDLEWLGIVVPAILQLVPESIFCMYCSSILAAQFCIEKWQLPPKRVMFIPAKAFKVYPGYLSLFDVALVPLENNIFNKCKSDLKLMEWNAAGVPYVAVDAPNYVRYHLSTEMVGGAIVDSQKEMIKEAVKMLRNPEQLENMSQSAMKMAKTNCDVKVRLAQYGYTLRVIRDNAKSPLKMPSVVSIFDASHMV